MFSIVPSGTDGSLEREPRTKVRGYFRLSLRDGALFVLAPNTSLSFAALR